MKNNGSDAGVQTVGKIYRDMKIDTEWSLVSGRGFTWWGHHYAQRIWADRPFEDGGVLITRVNAETDFLRFPGGPAEPEDLTLFAAGMQYATLSGPVVYEKPERIKLRCSAFIHEENQAWLGPLFSLAAVMQYAEVAFKAEELAPLLGAEPDKSGHPTSGHRHKMDDMLNIIDAFIVPEGIKPFNAIPERLFRQASEDLNNRGLFSTAGPEGLTAYVPFAGSTALLEVRADAQHPGLGKGLLYLMRLPPEKIASSSSIDGSLIMDLNALEQESMKSGHFLGSWCLAPGRGEHKSTPVYVTFIPAAVVSTSVFVNMIFSTITHCSWAEEVFSQSRLDFGRA
jgi:hypothetical protein